MTLPSDTAQDSPEVASRYRVLMLGATGTAGRATTQALLRSGHAVTCLVRGDGTASDVGVVRRTKALPDGVDVRLCDITDPVSLRSHGLCGDRFDVLVSCLASRTGVPADAWAIDHQAQLLALAAAQEAGLRHMVLLSAICVQRPRLAFQQAKLAFERELIDSGLTYSIVRPTAFFKSLSGQVARVRDGKPFLLFGDGRQTACKPISDRDLGDYIAHCLRDPARFDQILPIGGPGEAITPREQGEQLFALTGRKARFRSVPIALFDGARMLLEPLGRLSRVCADKAELARIGRYYATESMLVLDQKTGRYDAAATPSTGSDTLFDFYARLLDGSASVERREHAIFRERSNSR